ncbi:DE-cadherin-like [Oratosquilla oratoria]|uniref:DE-cadherin-like n=1 Tax=Oratosquilla oratoria TaxID=337810 RepID=UPI003F75A5A5
MVPPGIRRRSSPLEAEHLQPPSPVGQGGGTTQAPGGPSTGGGGPPGPATRVIWLSSLLLLLLTLVFTVQGHENHSHHSRNQAHYSHSLSNKHYRSNYPSSSVSHRLHNYFPQHQRYTPVSPLFSTYYNHTYHDTSHALSSPTTNPSPPSATTEETHHRTRHHHSLRSQRRRSAENLHQPKFSAHEYNGYVREDDVPGTSILTVEATDNDVNENGLLEYSVSDPEHFVVDEGGVIYSVKPLDFEHTGAEYTFFVDAIEKGPHRQRARVPVHLRVRDTPDPPIFDSPAYFFSVSESAIVGSYVGTIVALDPDNDFDRYELADVTPEKLFVVDPVNGIITIGAQTPENLWKYKFRALAFDKAEHSVSVDVTVNIIDENTNKPEFPNCSTYDGISVKENQKPGTNFLIVEAIDADHGINGEVVYQFLTHFDAFNIDNNTGQISTTRVLDRDLKDREFYLTVIAKDKSPSPLQGACSFKVIVEDVNDNAPTFDRPSYEKNIPSDKEAPSFLFRVTASDMDTGKNALIKYRLEGNNEGYFQIQEDTGQIELIKELDSSMANTKEFLLEAVAEDQGEKSLSSKAPVTLKVVSSGELPPTVNDIDPKNVTVSEDAADGTRVAVICASSNINGSEVLFEIDHGIETSRNSDGTFDIRPLRDYYCENGKAGEIYVAQRTLDFETVQQYQLLVQVANIKNARIDFPVTVTVLDVNDNQPIFKGTSQGSVLENIEKPTLVMTIVAQDKDISEEFHTVTYSISESDSKERNEVLENFRINRKNGELWTTQALDREKTKQYPIPITATDGTHNKTSFFWVTVNDENDVPPEFDLENGIYEVLLPENREVGKDTGLRLKVNDPDVVNEPFYQIVEGNMDDKFAINNKTGDITLNKKLDYDSPTNDRNFTMMVRVSDGKSSTITRVVISVQNMNDIPPVFSPAVYNFTVTENMHYDQPLGKMEATDPDLPPGANQDIRFCFSADDSTNFTINNVTGEIYLKGTLDREVQETVTVYPWAIDEGGDGIGTKYPAEVKVSIMDVNDNHPYILSPETSSSVIMENQDKDKVKPIFIKLDDRDTRVNGCPCTLEFDLDATGDDILSTFEISPAPGDNSQYHLTPKKMLDREERKTYVINFLTTDTQGLSGSRVFTIEVGDENDSPMTDGEGAITVYNYKGLFPTMIIGNVYVVDEDDYDVVDKVFEIDASTSNDVHRYFSVDEAMGNITMEQGTPGGTYFLIVKVEDKVRDETVKSRMTITVVDLPEDAVKQSGSLRVSGVSAQEFMTGNLSNPSLFKRFRKEVGLLFNLPAENVDIFTVLDVAKGVGVDVRFNAHNSPYYTAARLNGVLLLSRKELEVNLGMNISLIDINECLYESMVPQCEGTSCRHLLVVNESQPLFMGTETATVVGVHVSDAYDCNCEESYPLSPPGTTCPSDFCLNGGTCVITNGTLGCVCPTSTDYGPRCELVTALFKKGYAWFDPFGVCENASIQITFRSDSPNGVLMFAGPLVARPWTNYPPDYLAMVLNDWVLEVYLELGSGTANLSLPVSADKSASYNLTLNVNRTSVFLEIAECQPDAAPEDCRRTVPLSGFPSPPRYLLNLEGPLQLGGIYPEATPLEELAASYDWTIFPTQVTPFAGCVSNLKYNDVFYDLNKTDFSSRYYRTCADPMTGMQVRMGEETIFIIVGCLLLLILLILGVLCFMRRGTKSLLYSDMDGFVKETIGSTDIEGFGEKDVTHYNLNLLRVTPDGRLLTGEEMKDGRAVAEAQKQKNASEAPLALPEGQSIGDFIDGSKEKVDKENPEFDDVRHYCFEGDEDSVISLSSLGSGNSDNDLEFDYLNDWGHRFEKLAALYGRDTDEEDDSEYSFTVPSNKIPAKGKIPPTTAIRNSPTKKSPPGGKIPGANPLAKLQPQSGGDNPTSTTTTGGATSPEPLPPPPKDRNSQEVPDPVFNGVRSDSKRYNEAVNPLNAFDEIDGSESWC